MKYLIDTHTFLWFSAGNSEISSIAKQLIADRNNEIYVSIISLWEISIKTAIGKLEISGGYEQVIEDLTENEMEILSVNFAHTVIQNKLPMFHRDPFDRMLASQAIVENMSLISKDEIFDSYFSDKLIKRLW
ncbi:MAG: type II toxin-antitoxin system VapC family toxin [Bacteroidetes bacterium]|nr:type II toxin-antitoxin system VapC family toxin [Bacteroidota bacterium]